MNNIAIINNDTLTVIVTSINPAKSLWDIFEKFEENKSGSLSALIPEMFLKLSIYIFHIFHFSLYFNIK